MRGFKPWWTLLLIPLIPLWKAIFRGEAIGPWDHIRQFAPWFGPPASQPYDILQVDGSLQFYVWRDLVFDAWSKFQIPMWNAYELAGTPLLANSQSAALYPPHIVVGMLHIPTALGVTLLAWFHLALAGLGVFRLSRTLGASEAGALFAGVSFSLCPFMVSWTALASVITTVAWIPWALAFSIELLEAKPDLTSPKFRVGFAGVAVCLGMMFLGGHLQFAAYGCIAIAVVGLFRIRAGVRPILGWALACVAGVVIASPQLIPVLQYGQFSHRQGEATADGYQGYVASAIQPWQFGNLVNPQNLGNPRQPSTVARSSTYWPPLVKRGDNFAESAVSPGAVAVAFLCLAPFMWRRMRPAMGVVVAGLVGLLLAMGSPLTMAMYFGLPGWSSTGSPGRAIVLFLLAACVAAGLAASELFDPATRPKNPKPVQAAALIFAFLTAATLGLGISGAQTPAGFDHGEFQQYVAEPSTAGLFLTLIIAAIAVQPSILGYFRSRGPGTAPVGVLLPLGSIVCALLGGAATWIMTGKTLEAPKLDVKPHERVAFINDAWDLLSVPPANMPPNLSALFRIHELGGYDSLMHRDSVRLLHDIVGQDPAPPANGNIQFIKPSADPAKLGRAGVTKVFSVLKSNPPEQIVDPVQGPGRVTSEGGGAEVVAEDCTSVTVKATGPGVLTLRDRWMPGWTATVDGNRTSMPEGMWREVMLGAGDHEVRFTYAPPNFVPLAFFSVVTLIGMGVLARRPRRSDSPQATEPSEVVEAAAGSN